jgi:adenylate cyclase
MTKLDEKCFNIADWLVSPELGQLSRDGEIVRLEPKVMEVLVYFASNRGKVIPREELEREVWRGAIIGYDAITTTVIKLRKALQDDAKAPRYIVTIPKKGYQFIAEVTDVTPESEQTDVDKSDSHSPGKIVPRQVIAKNRHLIAGAVLILAAIFVWQLYKPARLASSPPTLLVLPFENTSNDKQQDIFVDGITEDIITDLSRLSQVMVMASNVTFTYKGKQVSLKAVKDELNVDYIVQGSIRRVGNSLRLNIQLIDTATGFNTWAQRYDKEPEQIFAVQDEISDSLIKALGIEQSEEEVQRLSRRATNNLLAYEYFLEGQRLSRISTKESNEQARDAYKQAITIDPTYGRAYGALAYVYAFDYRRGWTDNPNETLERALSLAEQSVGLDASIPQTYWSLGYVHMMRKEFNKAESAVSNAIRIAPNYADGYGLLSLINNNIGNAEKALEYATKGMKINPYYTWDYLYNQGRAYYTLGQYENAIHALEQAQTRNENAIPVKIFLTASYVKADRIEDAQWLIDQILVLNPETTIRHTERNIPVTDLKLKNRIIEDLRKAGLPEGE